MTLALTVLILLLVMILVIYVVQKYVPLDDNIKNIIIAIVVIAFLIGILHKVGIF
jgi:hypothetical protein